MDLDDEELQFTRDLNGASGLGKFRTYLVEIEEIQDKLSFLPYIDDTSVDLYEKVIDLLDGETDRVTELLKTKEAKLLKNKR